MCKCLHFDLVHSGLRKDGKGLPTDRRHKKDWLKSLFWSKRAGFSGHFAGDLPGRMEEAPVFQQISRKTGTFHASNPAGGAHPALLRKRREIFS
jgi:hypothetical protein